MAIRIGINQWANEAKNGRRSRTYIVVLNECYLPLFSNDSRSAQLIGVISRTSLLFFSCYDNSNSTNSSSSDDDRDTLMVSFLFFSNSYATPCVPSKELSDLEGFKVQFCTPVGPTHWSAKVYTLRDTKCPLQMKWGKRVQLEVLQVCFRRYEDLKNSQNVEWVKTIEQ